MKYGNIRSRATVAKAIAAARIIGWIVQNNPSEGLARDETSGRFKPKQWLFLDESMPHSEICEYDHVLLLSSNRRQNVRTSIFLIWRVVATC
jgi:hypothetical protein